MRSLKPSEMLDQIYRIQKDSGERVSNVVVMGTGEPLDNYDNLLRFIRLLTDENGLNISQRNLDVYKRQGGGCREDISGSADSADGFRYHETERRL